MSIETSQSDRSNPPTINSLRANLPIVMGMSLAAICATPLSSNDGVPFSPIDPKNIPDNGSLVTPNPSSDVLNVTGLPLIPNELLEKLEQATQSTPATQTAKASEIPEVVPEAPHTEPPKEESKAAQPQSKFTTEDIATIRQLFKEELKNQPMSPVAVSLAAISVIGIILSGWAVLRASRKLKQDFEVRRNDREELLFGRERTGVIVGEPKQLVIKEVKSEIPGEDNILEVDNPRIEILNFNPERDFGPYTLDIAKAACMKCTLEDPCFLEHFKDVKIQRGELFLDSAAERDWRHMRGSLTKSRKEICERALVKFKRELKFLAEKAYSEGAIDAVEGKSRTRQNIYIVPLCVVKQDGSREMEFYVVVDLEKLKNPITVQRMVADNPHMSREIEMIATLYKKELEFHASSSNSSKLPRQFRPGHSRYNQPLNGGRYMIPVGGWLRPKNGKG